MVKQLLRPEQIACFAVARNLDKPNDNTVDYETGPAFKDAEGQIREIPYKMKPKSPDGRLKYVIVNETQDIEGTLQEKKIIANAFRAWEYHIDLDIDRVYTEEEADVKVYFRTDDPYWKDRPNILAYAGYPELSLQGILVINDKHIWSMLGEHVRGHDVFPDLYPADSTVMLKTYILEQTIRHEFGHIIGLSHDDIHPDSNMGPYYSVTRIRLDVSEGSDADRAISKYGARSWIKKWWKSRWRRYMDDKLKKYND